MNERPIPEPPPGEARDAVELENIHGVLVPERKIVQPKLPCSMCRKAFREKAIVAYHSWYLGDNRTCYKQRICMRCWRDNYALVVAASTDQDDYDAPEKVDCHGCGEVLSDTAMELFTTWFRGTQRKATVLKECQHCSASLRQVMMAGSDRQEDRPMAGVQGGARPSLNPPAFGRDDLPW